MVYRVPRPLDACAGMAVWPRSTAKRVEAMASGNSREFSTLGDPKHIISIEFAIEYFGKVVNEDINLLRHEIP